MEELIEMEGSKQAAADRLNITKRYVNWILAGKKPSKSLSVLMGIYLTLGRRKG